MKKFILALLVFVLALGAVCLARETNHAAASQTAAASPTEPTNAGGLTERQRNQTVVVYLVGGGLVFVLITGLALAQGRQKQQKPDAPAQKKQEKAADSRKKE